VPVAWHLIPATDREQPVVVVGAGPVGLTAALALRAHQLPAVVLEAEPADRTRPGSRATFLHRESLEHLESVRPGLGWDLTHHGLVWSTKRTYFGEDLVYERTYPPTDGSRLPHSTNLSQVAIEQLLLAACKEAGVEVVWGDAVAACSPGPDAVVLRTAAGREWRADYIIGADGGNSVVRDGASVVLEGPRVEDAFVIVDVAEDAADPLPPQRVYFYDHPAVGGRSVLLVPFAGGIRADLQLRPDDDPDRFNDERGVQQWIGRVLPARYGDRVSWVSTYRFRQAVASAFTDAHRRVLLAGEAAHLFAPFGARGLNSGIPDALVAARAIAAARAEPSNAAAAIEHFATTRRAAALYNRDASTHALQHMRANDWRTRAKRRRMAGVAKRGLAAGAWLDSSPFGPRAADHQNETGSY
jgi:3-(3-hydroxy-phenyl)propionate hydroxylase